ncbi:FAD-binding protein [Adlercreutzia shanghongiae]|uniref:FAD-binding protein n=1 Tax=Adlercreutzia shanghongiae TaxID=3111773 RepID=A0ABU6IXS1_9ACTN|nr:FAD-binding protein [Adlercreutzia sp. R22]MEC4294647.1 FAD-binding protein [Adlercreutzia sp. R22]
MDRRSFFKLGGLTAGAAALAGGALAGCAPTSQSEMADTGAESAGTVAAAEVTASVFDTDILLIGGGFGASFAMEQACRAGQNLIVVDKAPYGFGGAFGMNFDIMHTWTPEAYYETADEVPEGTFVRDWSLFKQMKVQDKDEMYPEVAIANMGEILSPRNDDGTPFYLYDFPTTRGIEHSMTRHWSDYFRSKDYVTVHDKTMITDLIIEDGRCLGAVGIYLPTGEYRVYHAKATVSATGGSTQFFGWNSTSCTSNNCLDNTAEVEMSILRHGGRIADNEFCTYDLMTVYPRSFAASEGAMMGADSVHSGDLADADGNPLTAYVDPEVLTTQEGVIQAMALANDAGKGSENGGVYLTVTEESMPTMRWMYQRNAALLKRNFGFDFLKETVEVVPEMYEHGGQPLVDENAMCRDFEGLFVVRANSGSQGGNVNNTNRGMGRYAMKKAMEYVQSYEPLEGATYASVADEISRLEDLRTREIDDPLRPITVRRNVQYACAEAGRPVRPVATLEAARDELERILAEDVPRMACADKSRTYNLDWKDAIETLNLLDEARLFVAGSLEREESRDSLIRPEFPDVDDVNWKCSLAYTRAEDGTLTSEKITY